MVAVPVGALEPPPLPPPQAATNIATTKAANSFTLFMNCSFEFDVARCSQRPWIRFNWFVNVTNRSRIRLRFDRTLSNGLSSLVQVDRICLLGVPVRQRPPELADAGHRDDGCCRRRESR